MATTTTAPVVGEVGELLGRRGDIRPDLRTIHCALAHGWDIPPETRARLLPMVVAIVEDAHTDARTRILAFRCVLLANQQNIALERMDCQRPGSVVNNFSGPTQINAGAMASDEFLRKLTKDEVAVLLPALRRIAAEGEPPAGVHGPARAGSDH